MWDPVQYGQFAAERSRAFVDLLAHVELDHAGAIVDLGCGSGELTATLAQRWPGARVRGVDSSAQMLAAAQQWARPARVDFEQADLASWQPDGPLDLVVSNAALQWVPDHAPLLARFASWLAPGGVLAIQVPGNGAAPSHTALRELRGEARWRDRAGEGADRLLSVLAPQTYQQLLLAAGLQPVVWESTYLQLLTGNDPVLEWMRGTALRPVLAALGADSEDFLAELAPRLRAAYPPGPHGTVLAFRRLFAVGRRPGGPPPAPVRGLDHVQIPIPPDGEERARPFYAGLLGLVEIAKPEPLRAAGGAWFTGPAGLALHLGAQLDVRPAEKAHIALRVGDLTALAEALTTAGYPARWDSRVTGPPRLYTKDPFGNRIELLGSAP